MEGGVALSLWAKRCCQPSLWVPHTFSLETVPLEQLRPSPLGSFPVGRLTASSGRGLVLLTSLACLVQKAGALQFCIGWMDGQIRGRRGGQMDSGVMGRQKQDGWAGRWVKPQGPPS